MSVHKFKVIQSFTQIPNNALQDPRLSFEAKGLLALIWSMPSDWKMNKTWLQKQSANCGRDKLVRLISELQEAGYIEKKRVKEKNGRFAGWDWFINPVEAANGKTFTERLKTRRTDKPKDWKSAKKVENIRRTENPYDGFSAPTNKQIKTNKKKVSESVISTARAKNFSLTKIMESLKEMGMPSSEKWYAHRKAQEYAERFPESRSVVDACRYVVNAIDHAWRLEGRA